MMNKVRIAFLVPFLAAFAWSGKVVAQPTSAAHTIYLIGDAGENR